VFEDFEIEAGLQRTEPPDLMIKGDKADPCAMQVTAETVQ
jgi:hypothetical protein